MTKARIQSLCRANNINLGYYVGDGVFLRSVTNRDGAFLYTTIIFVKYENQKVIVLVKLLKNLKVILK